MIEGLLNNVLGGNNVGNGLLENLLGNNKNIDPKTFAQQTMQQNIPGQQGNTDIGTNLTQGIGSMLGIENGANTNAGGNIGQGIGSALGNLIPIPGLGTALGGLGGNLLGSWIGSMFNKEPDRNGGAKTENEVKQMMQVQ